MTAMVFNACMHMGFVLLTVQGRCIFVLFMFHMCLYYIHTSQTVSTKCVPSNGTQFHTLGIQYLSVNCSISKSLQVNDKPL